MAQVTIKGLHVLKNVESKLKDAANEKLEERFTHMANFAINESPVWSGAYVKSFSFKAGNSSSRGRRVDGANWKFPERTGSEVDREVGRSLLLGDIQTAFVDNDPLETKSYTFRNDSNHAKFVEYGVGGPTGPKPPNGYRIFERLKEFKSSG